jgi:integrase
MASISANKGKNGDIISYRFRACIGRDEMGKQKFASKTVKVEGAFAEMTPKKLEKSMQLAADEWEHSIITGTVPVKKRTFKYFVEEIWMPLQVNDGQHRPNTIEFYKDVTSPLVHALGSNNLDAITAVDIQKYLKNIAESSTSATVSRHYRVLKTIFKYAARIDAVPRNIMDKVTAPRQQGKRNVEYLSKEQAQELIATLNIHADPMWRTMMLLLMTSGLRRGEALGLQWQDLDLKNGMLSVNRNVTMTKTGLVIGEPKTAKSRRSLPIATSMINILRGWKNTQESKYEKISENAFVFSSLDNQYQPLTPHAVTRWLWKFCKDYELTPCHPHMLRHTAATLMLDSGASIKEVQETLGHTDASTTLNFYVGTSPEALRRATDNLAKTLDI